MVEVVTVSHIAPGLHLTRLSDVISTMDSQPCRLMQEKIRVSSWFFQDL